MDRELQMGGALGWVLKEAGYIVGIVYAPFGKNAEWNRLEWRWGKPGHHVYKSSLDVEIQSCFRTEATLKGAVELSVLGADLGGPRETRGTG